MELNVYSIHDKKTGVYNSPFYQATHGEAERTFTKLTNDQGMINQFPEDYTLCYLGKFDDVKGIFTAVGLVEHLVSAPQVLKPKH